MAKINVEIDDTLQERVDTSKRELMDEVQDYIVEHADIKSVEEVYEAIEESMSEIADSNTPVYTKDIGDLFYVHHQALTDAYEDAYGPLHQDERDEQHDWRATAICVYIEAELQKFWNGDITDKIQSYIEHRDEGEFTATLPEDRGVDLIEVAEMNDAVRVEYVKEHFTV